MDRTVVNNYIYPVLLTHQPQLSFSDPQVPPVPMLCWHFISVHQSIRQW